MTNMTIEQLYDYLNSPDFQKADGNIFYNYYIYQYPASKEYLMRQQIVDFKEKLERPTTYINAMILDLFQVFCDYLSEEKFGDRSLLEDTLEEDRLHPDMVTTELTTEANSDNFIHYVNGGNTTYYRFHHGERLLTPEQQKWIINLFRRHGYTEELHFDGYRNVYDFTFG